jgi:hypothetical protein
MAREFASIVYCQDTVQSKDIIHVYECRIRVFFLGEKKTRNTKITFLGLGRFFLLPAKNFGLFELPHSSPAQITSHPKP